MLILPTQLKENRGPMVWKIVLRIIKGHIEMAPTKKGMIVFVDL